MIGVFAAILVLVVAILVSPEKTLCVLAQTANRFWAMIVVLLWLSTVFYRYKYRYYQYDSGITVVINCLLPIQVSVLPVYSHLLPIQVSVLPVSNQHLPIPVSVLPVIGVYYTSAKLLV